MSNAVMPLTDYVAACDAVREKTGSADTIKSGEMPDKINDVFKSGQLDIISNAEALKGSASGTDIIAIDDTNPVEHSVSCMVESKNLLQLPEINCTGAGVAYISENGFLKLNGTKYGQGVVTLSNVNITLQPGTYTISMRLVEGTFTMASASSKIHLYLDYTNYGTLFDVWVNNDSAFDKTVTLSETTTITRLQAGIWNDNDVMENVVLSWQIEKGSTATEYTPYIEDLSAVTVKRLGKNLCNTGTATFTRSITIELPTPIPANTPFVFSGIFETDYTGTGNLIQFYYIDGTTERSNWRMFSVGVTDRQKVTGNFSKAIKSITVYAGANWSSSAGLTGTLTDVQFEIGSTATEYEPYIESTEHTANSDGTVEGVRSLSPNMTLIPDTEGVIISAEYIKDIDKAFEAVTTAVALTGGE